MAIRELHDDKDIFGYDRYFLRHPDSIKGQWDNWKKKIGLRFTQRIAANDKAFDLGYYKTSFANI